MAYTWKGMAKMSWFDVVDRHRKGELVGCFKLYDDDTEGMIEPDYQWADIIRHHDNGGEFGYEIDGTVDMESEIEKMILAVKDNRQDLKKARESDNLAETSYCLGYDAAMMFALCQIGVGSKEVERRIKEMNNGQHSN